MKGVRCFTCPAALVCSTPTRVLYIYTCSHCHAALMVIQNRRAELGNEYTVSVIHDDSALNRVAAAAIRCDGAHDFSKRVYLKRVIMRSGTHIEVDSPCPKCGATE